MNTIHQTHDLLNGFSLITMPIPMVRVQARRHKRKSNRRWQKKWLKRFGTKDMPAISKHEIENRIYVDQKNLCIYGYPHAIERLRSMRSHEIHEIIK